jgi:predicted nucleotidyltransferase
MNPVPTARSTRDALSHLNGSERSCVERYLSFLDESLGSDLMEVWLFGSAARGDMWGANMPMKSDIDILVVTRNEISADRRETLINETYPLYLECGRQISPQFWSEANYSDPPTESKRELRRQLSHEGQRIYP